MKINFKTMCRGDGKGFVLVEVQELGAASSVALCVVDEQGAVLSSGLYLCPEDGRGGAETPPEAWFDETHS
ncbi:hypothetical protein, partial [Gordonibacter sp.]|uniref:hypothetical protein n=1 Tax=Gordonibacter sp. TaxID=1968902 RepID=UPI002FCAFB15